ncbi:hypothetical protein WS70_18820 [Burkholderia mayonis]|uniref:Uncharacterized protein n=1 Tax=Burkholderia mayonis TaxID=1385591 RepID=A0A1B4FJV2_9BURK|nr:hypothetical protein WS70_18820 [Burkholderia mayonis]KVE49195.1 hypothetical protein WS70_20200 [Burkholderia mayonis]
MSTAIARDSQCARASVTDDDDDDDDASPRNSRIVSRLARVAKNIDMTARSRNSGHARPRAWRTFARE